MDILNWLYLRKQQLIKKTVNNATTDLVVLGADATFAKRDDKYKTYAMTVEDFATAVALPPAYKVFTGIFTQIGASNLVGINSGNLTIGITYTFDALDITQWDFTNVGGPKYPDTTSFIATGTTPNAWGSDWLYDTGAPVVTVLENTIGNVWFNFGGVGLGYMNSDALFTLGKTIALGSASGLVDDVIINFDITAGQYQIPIYTKDINNDPANNYGSAIEIRVYN